MLNPKKNRAMKTSRLIQSVLFSVIFIFITGFASYAKSPVSAPAESIQKMIKGSLSYTDQAIKKGCYGTVNVVFTVDENGKINITKYTYTCPEIAKIVKEQLSNVCCKGIKVPYNEHFEVTITYKLIG
jgi:hypothetical protein